MIKYIIFAISFFLLFGCERIQAKKEKVGNTELAFYERGQGEPLIMITGFRATMSVWDPGLLDQLEKNYRIILFDNRGVGLSPEIHDEPLTISQMAKDTAEFIRKLGYEKAHVLGWSMGSAIAMELALSHPEVVKSLILCSANPGGNHQVKSGFYSYDDLRNPELSFEAGLSMLFPDSREGREAANSFKNRLALAIETGNIPYDFEMSNQVIDNQLHAIKEWDQNDRIYEKLPNIKAPTLVASGLLDKIDPPENAQIVACRIPYSWLVFFPEAGHAFHSQDYEAFAKLVTIFIESNRTDK